MKNLIDASFFNNDINIPNTDKAAVQEKVEGLVKENQSNFLRTVLGADLYWDLKTAYEAIPEDGTEEDLDQKWQDLLNGKETKEFDFKGVKKMMGYYIYDIYVTSVTSFLTGLGEVSPGKENALNSRPIYRQVEAYNNMLAEFWKMTQLFKTWDPVPADYKVCRDFLSPKNWLNL